MAAAEVVLLVPGPCLLVGLGKGTSLVTAGLGEGEVKCAVLEEVVSVVKVGTGLILQVGGELDLMVVVKLPSLTADKTETF